MKELLETIKIEDGQVMNIEWHNRRCNRSREELFGTSIPLNLESFITPPPEGLYRCRKLYNQEVTSVEYLPYSIKLPSSFKVVKSQIEYSHKYSNRRELNALLHPSFDEIIIEKNGLLTDTSIANIAFYNETHWVTPRRPLLQGTMREKLLTKGFLISKDIKISEIKEYSHFALMNAMIGFQIQKNIIIQSQKEKLCL
jgi:4-amino-4-deoxychorismate lyase